MVSRVKGMRTAYIYVRLRVHIFNGRAQLRRWFSRARAGGEVYGHVARARERQNRTGWPRARGYMREGAGVLLRDYFSVVLRIYGRRKRWVGFLK